jgi:predicted GH43/DUF377 family glycosyl hydrolase
MKLTRYINNPILSPNPANDWESLVTTNPGAWRDEASGDVLMLYRAAGADAEHRIFLGLARSKDGYHFERQADQPVLLPSIDGFDAGCVEDPRIIKMGEWYYVTYATRPFPPGEYWLHEERRFKAPQCPPEFPAMLRHNASLTGLGLTRDFKTWIRAGLMTHPEDDNRDVILFPEKVGGKYWMMHRPANLVGEAYGLAQPAIWISSSTDLLTWDRGSVLAKGELAWEGGKIGGNTPPIKTALGWLTLYHAVGADKRYRLGALILDADDPRIVRYRSSDWLLQPEEWYELEGYYPGVCFPCGKVVIDDTLFVYYGGADRYTCLATCSLGELLEYLRQCPV